MKSLIIIFFSCFLVSCAVMSLNYNNDSNVQRLEIGMDKEQVVNVMGNKYTLETTFINDDNEVCEVIKFDSTYDSAYLIHFINGKLVLVEKFYPLSLPTPQNVIVNNKE